jgi:hypothetical protein
MENQAKRINQSLDDFVRAAIEAVEETKKTAAVKCLGKVITKSPVWSGPYVKSHHIGVGNIDLRSEQPFFGTLDEVIMNKLSDGQALSLKRECYQKEKSKLKNNIPIETPVYVSNSIGYANAVEYGFSTNISGGRSGGASITVQPHHVYGLTVEEIKINLPNILKLEVSKNIKLNKK